eukprot:9474723-Pyramimonas_sp.AAC.1
MTEALNYFKQYAMLFPQESCEKLEELIHSTGTTLFDKLKQAPTTDEDKSAKLLTDAQRLFQSCWTAFPTFEQYDMFIQGCAEILSSSVNKNFTATVCNLLEELLSASESARDADPLVTLVQVLEERSGLLSADEFEKGEAALLKIAKSIFRTMANLLDDPDGGPQCLFTDILAVCRALYQVLSGCMHACREENKKCVRTLHTTTKYIVDVLERVRPAEADKKEVDVQHIIAMEMGSALQLARSVKSLKGSCKSVVLEGAPVSEVAEKLSD